LIQIFSKFNSGCKVLYLHTDEISDSWKTYLMHMLVVKSGLCKELLNSYDVVGCKFSSIPKKHFAFNYWWTMADYVSGLNTNEKYEWFILSDPKVKYYCVSDAYPDDNYKQFDVFNDNIKIKCVNLLRRPDRKEQITKQLEKESLISHTSFFAAVDGQQLNVTDDIKKLFNGNDFGSKRGVIGCALSHYYLWQELLEDNVEYYFIIEDDVDICDNFIFKMNNVLYNMKKKEWDIIYFGYSERNKISSNNNTVIEYDKRNNIGGTFAYILNKRCAKKFLTFANTNGIKNGIDYFMFHYDKEMKIKQYQVIPQLITSEYVFNGNNIDSDIQYDYNKLF